MIFLVDFGWKYFRKSGRKNEFFNEEFGSMSLITKFSMHIIWRTWGEFEKSNPANNLISLCNCKDI